MSASPNLEDQQLEHNWQLYRLKLETHRKNVKIVMTPKMFGEFSTICGMWSWMKEYMPSKLDIGDDIYQFKNGIKPIWEDNNNKNGGRWSFVIKNHNYFDEIWLRIHLGISGETLDPNNQINGILLSLRKGYIKISIWTRDKYNKKDLLEIGTSIKNELCDVDSVLASTDVLYQDHFQIDGDHTVTGKFGTVARIIL